MKIALIGAQGVGKTTLLKKIENSGLLQGYKFADEIVRTLVRDVGIKVNKEGDYGSQLSIFQAHKAYAEQYTNLVTDRSCIDAMAYAEYNSCYFSASEKEEFYYYFKETLKLYDLVFYIPIEFDIVDDGFRSTDQFFQREIDKIFCDLFLRFDIKVISLRGSLNDRFLKFRESYEEKCGDYKV